MANTKNRQSSATEQMKLLAAMFEGRQISDAEARKIVVATNRRNRVLREMFDLSKDDVGTLCTHKKEVAELLQTFCVKKQEEVQARVREVETRALAKMRDPDQARRIRALLAPR